MGSYTVRLVNNIDVSRDRIAFTFEVFFVYFTLKLKALCCFKKSVSNYQSVHCDFTET
jgi:hypothetical protein